MDFVQGIPVEYELDAFSMPSTGTTSCHPKKCRSEHNSALDTSLLFSSGPHMETMQTLPQIPDSQNYTVTLNTIPHTSRNTRCHINIPLRHFVSNTNKPKLHESCSTKSKPYSKLQIKNFLCCVVKEKFRHSFVLPKKYSVREINYSSNHYKLLKFIYALPLKSTDKLNRKLELRKSICKFDCFGHRFASLMEVVCESKSNNQSVFHVIWLFWSRKKKNSTYFQLYS